MSKDITRNPLIAVNGYLGLDELEVDAGLISELAVDSDRKIWWQERLDRCLKLL
jgi:hypothetical protein